MYTSHFGFREVPFSVTPDPRFFYTNSFYQEAFATLFYGIKSKKGFIVITGEVGTGKTTLLRKLIRSLDPADRSVFIFNTYFSFPELLCLIMHDLGLTYKGKSKVTMIQDLNEYLIEQRKEGHTVSLLIDEAQNLSDEALEGIRLLSNLETDNEKLLQIVLMGQPELGAKLNKPSLRQLKQRIAHRIRLDPLQQSEVGNYIRHRLEVSGYEGPEIFPQPAIENIWRYSRGTPRLINIICENALLIAYATDKRIVTMAMIDEVAHDLWLKKAVEAVKPEVPTGKIMAKNGKEQAVRPVRGKPFQVKPRPLAGAVAGALLVLLFLGGAAFVIDPLQTEDRLSSINVKVESLLGIAGKTFKYFDSKLISWETVPEKAQLSLGSQLSAEPGLDPQDPVPPNPNAEPPASARLNDTVLPELYEKVDAGTQESSTTLDPSTRALAMARGPSLGIPLEIRGVVLSERSESKDDGIGAPGLPGELHTHPPGEVKRAVAGKWKDEPIVIEYGSTVFGIADDFYGAKRILAIDLLKEFNPHIENLSRVLAGQNLWLPPLTRETLLRRQGDGSYRLILASFPSSMGADAFAQVIRHKGYQVVITPRRISDDLLLHRVEIDGLKNLEAVNQAWNTALGDTWPSFPDRFTAGRSGESLGGLQGR